MAADIVRVSDSVEADYRRSPLPQLLTQLIHRRRMEVRAVVAGYRVEVAEAEPISGQGVGRAEVDHGGRLGDEVAAVQCRGWR